MRPLAFIILALSAPLALTTTPSAQAKRYALESTKGLHLHNVVAEVTTLAEVARQFKALDATVADPSHLIGAQEYLGDSEEEHYARQVVAHAEQLLRERGRDAQPVLGRLRSQLRQLAARRVCE